VEWVSGGILASVTPFIILWGMVGGMVTPTEAGILAIAWSVIVGLIYRDIDTRELRTFFMNRLSNSPYHVSYRCGNIDGICGGIGWHSG